VKEDIPAEVAARAAEMQAYADGKGAAARALLLEAETLPWWAWRRYGRYHKTARKMFAEAVELYEEAFLMLMRAREL
jgi:hypothetical protein